MWFLTILTSRPYLFAVAARVTLPTVQEAERTICRCVIRMDALKHPFILTAFLLTLCGFKDAHFCQLCNFSV